MSQRAHPTGLSGLAERRRMASAASADNREDTLNVEEKAEKREKVNKTLSGGWTKGCEDGGGWRQRGQMTGRGILTEPSEHTTEVVG